MDDRLPAMCVSRFGASGAARAENDVWAAVQDDAAQIAQALEGHRTSTYGDRESVCRTHAVSFR